jgi:hypothetical protein
MKLYEITAALEGLSRMAEDPDVPQEAVQDTLEGVLCAFEDKAHGIMAIQKNLEAEAKAIKEATDAMTSRRRSLERKAKWLKGYLLDAMQAAGMDEVKTAQLVARVKKNPASVVIDDPGAIPADYKETIVEEKPNKRLLKLALQDGDVAGCHLEQGVRLEVK